MSLFVARQTPTAPGVMYFSSEQHFPQIVRLSLYFTIHHNFAVYEHAISEIVGGNTQK